MMSLPLDGREVLPLTQGMPRLVRFSSMPVCKLLLLVKTGLGLVPTSMLRVRDVCC
jgi:hypothetical protein